MTCIVVLQSEKQIVLAADSKATSIGQTDNGTVVNKIVQVGANAAFAIAHRHWIYDFNALVEGEKIIQAAANISDANQEFILQVKTNYLANVKSFLTNEPEVASLTFYPGALCLQSVFAAMEQGRPHVYATTFTLEGTDLEGCNILDIGVETEPYVCLGQREAADQEWHKLIYGLALEFQAQQLVSAQIKSTPEWVGPPIKTVILRADF